MLVFVTCETVIISKVRTFLTMEWMFFIVWPGRDPPLSYFYTEVYIRVNRSCVSQIRRYRLKHSMVTVSSSNQLPTKLLLFYGLFIYLFINHFDKIRIVIEW